jgi:hypothetical protein
MLFFSLPLRNLFWVMASGFDEPLSRSRESENGPGQTQARSGDAGVDPSHIEPQDE